MKVLKNKYDYEIKFTDLEEAKYYYTPKEDKPCDKEDYLGEDFACYCEEFNRYKREIANSETLEQLAEVLTRFTDIFDNGSEYYVKEI